MKLLKKQLELNQRAERRLLNKPKNILMATKVDPLLAKIEDKIPPKLQSTLEALFEKAFIVVFDKGTPWIEKTYNKSDLEVEHLLTDFVYEQRQTRRSARRVEKSAKRSLRWGKGIAFVEGAGLGFLGIGLPDIPVFTGVLLKGIYEVALSYGFDYNLYEEKIYILKLIQTSLAQDALKPRENVALDRFGHEVDLGIWSGSLESEITLAARALSRELLVAKFIQGLPVVGVAGAIFNRNTYKKVSDFAAIKYKKRYLEKKL